MLVKGSSHGTEGIALIGMVARGVASSGSSKTQLLTSKLPRTFLTIFLLAGPSVGWLRLMSGTSTI